MLGENDGPSMVSYATTGATYGIGFFVPFILLTFLMAYVVQEMTVRLGVATHRGHAELIFQRFGPFWGYFAMGDLVFGNLLTLVTEFIAIQAGGLYFGVPPWLSVAIGVALVIGSLAFRRYATWERVLMGLAAFNLLFVPAALLAHPDGAELVHALATWGPLPGGFTTRVPDAGPRQRRRDRDAVDDLLPAERRRRQGPDPADLRRAGWTPRSARCWPRWRRSRRWWPPRRCSPPRSTFRNSPTAPISPPRCPLSASTGATLFALGILEAGLVAAMTISTSSSYALAETCRRRQLGAAQPQPRFRPRAGCSTARRSSRRSWRRAIVLIPGAPLLAMTLTVNVIATLLMAPALLLLLLLANDREIMGDLANGRLANSAGGTIVVAHRRWSARSTASSRLSRTARISRRQSPWLTIQTSPTRSSRPSSPPRPRFRCRAASSAGRRRSS